MPETREQRKAREQADLDRLMAEFKAKGGEGKALPKGAAGYRIFNGKLVSITPLISENGKTYDNLLVILNFKTQKFEEVTARSALIEGLETGKNYRFPTKMNLSTATSLTATMRLSRRPEALKSENTPTNSVQ